MKRPVFRRNSANDTAAPSGEAKSSESAESNATEGESASSDSELEAAMDADLDAEEVDASASVSGSSAESASQDSAATARLEAEVKENYDKYLRAVAELENYKKRAIRERSDLLKYAGENIARDLLEVVDTFQLALAQNVEGVNEEFLKGIKMIFDRFIAILEQHSVRGESVLGKPFDPNTQQALASVPSSEHIPNTVIEEFKRAYFFKDKLLRPAQVVVAIADSGADSAKPGESGPNGAA